MKKSKSKSSYTGKKAILRLTKKVKKLEKLVEGMLPTCDPIGFVYEPPESELE